MFLISRHAREDGHPLVFVFILKIDSRLRGNDVYKRMWLKPIIPRLAFITVVSGGRYRSYYSPARACIPFIQP
ncbi:MAG: hypothetical protein JW927_15205 [Deltaproteobacteria bacterium]|nr:hypothetical protein [Deltaproteobacteria bacterium]